MRWFRDGFCPDAKEAATREGISSFDVMERWAQDIPAGSNGLVAVMANSMHADAWHHAAPALVGFDINDPDRFNRGTSVRAIEEAAAFVAREHLAVLAELTGGRATASGQLVFTGGSSAGALWPQIMSGVTGLDVLISRVAEATSYGAARLAAAGVGILLPPVPRSEAAIHPLPTDAAQYDEAFAHWQNVYRSQLVATSASGTTPLFTPPGGLPLGAVRTTEITTTKEHIHG
jgi:autoinducer 2 (AI-2) kinase